MITREDNVAMNMGRGAYGKLQLQMNASCKVSELTPCLQIQRACQSLNHLLPRSDSVLLTWNHSVEHQYYQQLRPRCSLRRHLLDRGARSFQRCFSAFHRRSYAPNTSQHHHVLDRLSVYFGTGQCLRLILLVSLRLDFAHHHTNTNSHIAHPIAAHGSQ